VHGVRHDVVIEVDGTEWTLDEVRQYAESERDIHDPAQQEDNGYERCAHCHYTRHPCSVYDLATIVLALLDTHQDSI
jgi:hypothetical protein